jgi:hypothetical protein
MDLKGWEDLCGEVSAVEPYEDSPKRIESLFQALTTGAAVKEFRDMLKVCGLVPGHLIPRYRLDVVSTDPFRAEASYLRRNQEMLLGGVDDVLTPFTNNDAELAEVRAAVSNLNAALDKVAPHFRQGLLGSLSSSGDLYESAGEFWAHSARDPSVEQIIQERYSSGNSTYVVLYRGSACCVEEVCY